MKRIFDLLLSAAALVLLAPVFVFAAVAVVVESGFPVLFSQTRIGLHGRPFRLWKFRTMRAGELGPPITVAGDTRLTRTGRLLRRLKFDELPQLFNVFTGTMSVIGPRPEIPAFVDEANQDWRAILAVRPGLFDPASLEYADEARLLASFADPIAAYRTTVLPRKLSVSRRYLEGRTLLSDLKLIYRALRMVSGFPSVTLEL